MYKVRSANANCSFTLLWVHLSREVVQRGGFLRRIIWVLVRQGGHHDKAMLVGEAENDNWMPPYSALYEIRREQYSSIK